MRSHPSTAVDARPSSRHVPQLDGLRGSAVLMVMLLHFSSQLSTPATASARLVVDAFSFGWAGVDVFFVLSGFLITGILYDARHVDSYFRPFYARRALRIMPLYYGALIFLFVLAPTVTATPRADWGELRWYWVYLGNFRFESTPTREWIGHFWSLAIEEQFYLVWPLVIRFCSRRRALAVCAAAIIGSLVYRVAALHFGILSSNVYHVTPARLDGLAVGAAIALLSRDSVDLERLRRWKAVATTCALFILALIIVRRGWPIPFVYETVTIGYTAVALLAGALLTTAVTATASAPVARLLCHPALTFWGRYSYALYVVHVPLIAATKRAGFHPTQEIGFESELSRILLYTAALTAASVAVALASWHLLEKHFLRLKPLFELARPEVPIPGPRLLGSARATPAHAAADRSSARTASITPAGSSA